MIITMDENAANAIQAICVCVMFSFIIWCPKERM